MGRDCHYSACAVFHKHKICCPDWKFISCQRINCVTAGENSFFFLRVFRKRLYLFYNIFIPRQFPDKRMPFSNTHKCCAEKGILSGSKDSYCFIRACNFKINLNAFTPSNPVALHGNNPFRPASQRITIF